jgi:hypothetical protein
MCEMDLESLGVPKKLKTLQLLLKYQYKRMVPI